MNEYVYVVCYCHRNSLDEDLMWCAKTFDGAYKAIDSSMQNNEEELQDTDHNWDDEWRYFTDSGTYTITRMPLNP